MAKYKEVQIMALYYKLYKNNVQGSEMYGKWYAKMVVKDVIQTEDIADVIQRNCSIKRSDVMAVLTELSEVISDQLKAGNRVVLNGIGSFKAGIHSKPANSPSEFASNKNIYNPHIVFKPETKTITTAGTRSVIKKAIEGIEYKQLTEYTTATTKTAE